MKLIHVFMLRFPSGFNGHNIYQGIPPFPGDDRSGLRLTLPVAVVHPLSLTNPGLDSLCLQGGEGDCVTDVAVQVIALDIYLCRFPSTHPPYAGSVLLKDSLDASLFWFSIVVLYPKNVVVEEGR